MSSSSARPKPRNRRRPSAAGREVTIAVVAIGCVSCAQVPRESVELSVTVGRDIAEVYRAHHDLAVLLYDRIKADVNTFVDDVYAPYQIQKVLEADFADFKANDPESVFFKLNAAIENPNDADAQKEALEYMGDFVILVREEVEAYRAIRLEPVLQQEAELLGAIDRSYRQIHYANSIVTGHLASIVQVHDAQEELLNELGIEGLRDQVGVKLANISKDVAKFVDSAERVEGTLDQVEAKIADLTKKLDAAARGEGTGDPEAN